MDVQATQMRAGMMVRFRGDICTIHKMEHRTPGKGHGFVQIKMRSHRSGSMLDQRFASEESLPRVNVQTQQMQYLYSDGTNYVLMNTETYEQIELSADQLGDQVNYMIPETIVRVQFLDDVPFNLDLPSSVVLKVVETEPAIKSATVTNVNKPAKTETGLVVPVPQFIKEGESIKVNTEDGSYLGRA